MRTRACLSQCPVRNPLFPPPGQRRGGRYTKSRRERTRRAPWRLAMDQEGHPGAWRWREGAELREAPVPRMLRRVRSCSGPGCPGLWGWAASMNQACRRAVQASLATCSLVGEDKASLPARLHPHPPARPAGFQGERGLAGAAPPPPLPPGLPYCQRAGLGRPAWKILGSHSSSFWGFSQGAVPPPLPRTVLTRPRRRAPAPQPIISQPCVGSWGWGVHQPRRKHRQFL